MDKTNQTFQDANIITDNDILALSWNIATEPKLYRELAQNPYSCLALQIIAIRFPHICTSDIARAIILAEPEGRYDKNFRLLEPKQQIDELRKQKDITIKINKQLVKFCKKYRRELILLPKEILYEILTEIVFKTADLKEIELRYAQNQRRDFKLLIINFIEDAQKSKSRPLGEDSNSLFAITADKKRAQKLLLLLIGFIVFSTLSFFHLTQNIDEKSVPIIQTVSRLSHGLPIRLRIPGIHVDAAVEKMGLTSAEAMDVPDNTIDVGWYKFGPIPGEIGSAVIAGHFDGRIGESGVFDNLDKLKRGDKIFVVNNLGTTTTFIVRESRTYSPGYAADVFDQRDDAHLNLITCDGTWDGVKKSYNKRLVVFADIAH